jgi:hypothetical protein
MRAMYAVRDAVARAGIGSPVRCRNLTMIPLVASDEHPAGYLTFGDARRRGAASITETSEHGTVPELRFVNAGPDRVLLIDGEELVGAKQNRIVNLTILVPERQTIAIPVSCVEAGRWSARSREFTESSRAMFREARARKLADVSASLARGGRRDTDQGAVWRDVADKSARMAARSQTSAMSDIFEQHHATVEEYVAGLAPVERQVGALFAIGGRVAGLELFDVPDTLASYLPTLMRSYALDAMEQMGQGASRSEPHAAPLDPAEVARALDELLSAGAR